MRDGGGSGGRVRERAESGVEGREWRAELEGADRESRVELGAGRQWSEG